MISYYKSYVYKQTIVDLYTHFDIIYSFIEVQV